MANSHPQLRTAATLSLLLALVLMSVGCQDGAWKLRPKFLESGPDGDAPWTIKPVDLRVFPSSRFTVREGEAVLEARVEFFDDAGDSTKAVGHLRFELFHLGLTGEETLGRRLYAWEVPMNTLEQNRMYYDRITRAYLFNLRMLDPSPASQRVLMIVYYQPPHGQRLEARHVLE